MGQTDTAPTEGVGQAGEAAKEQARQVSQQAAEKGREAADKARGRAREQVDQLSTQAGDQLSTIAGDTRAMGPTDVAGTARAGDRARPRAGGAGRLGSDVFAKDPGPVSRVGSPGTTPMTRA